MLFTCGKLSMKGCRMTVMDTVEILLMDCGRRAGVDFHRKVLNFQRALGKELIPNNLHS